MKAAHETEDRAVTLFLGGDVMTGRGIDQILPVPGDPRLHESYVKTATRYVELAEQANGPLPKPATLAYPWGDALRELERVKPHARIINLETAVTRSNDYWPHKAVHYRMHPANIGCLLAAGIDCCVLANNHVLDWGYAGLDETLETLANATLRSAGAGTDAAAASAPAVIDLAGKGRVLVFAYAMSNSGVPQSWAASSRRAGVNLLEEFSQRAIERVSESVHAVRRRGDIVVASIHWGGNWGYEIGEEYRNFAHRLIDDAGIDLVHGHSSHHAKAIEVYKDRLVLYGCGDLVNDYEGIGGHERFRADLVLMYFATMSVATGQLTQLNMTPFALRRFRLNYASDFEAQWLGERLDRECERFGHRIGVFDTDPLVLRLQR